MKPSITVISSRQISVNEFLNFLHGAKFLIKNVDNLSCFTSDIEGVFESPEFSIRVRVFNKELITYKNSTSQEAIQYINSIRKALEDLDPMSSITVEYSRNEHAYHKVLEILSLLSQYFPIIIDNNDEKVWASSELDKFTIEDLKNL